MALHERRWRSLRGVQADGGHQDFMTPAEAELFERTFPDEAIDQISGGSSTASFERVRAKSEEPRVFVPNVPLDEVVRPQSVAGDDANGEEISWTAGYPPPGSIVVVDDAALLMELGDDLLSRLPIEAKFEPMTEFAKSVVRNETQNSKESAARNEIRLRYARRRLGEPELSRMENSLKHDFESPRKSSDRDIPLLVPSSANANGEFAARIYEIENCEEVEEEQELGARNPSTHLIKCTLQEYHDFVAKSEQLLVPESKAHVPCHSGDRPLPRCCIAIGSISTKSPYSAIWRRCDRTAATNPATPLNSARKRRAIDRKLPLAIDEKCTHRLLCDYHAHQLDSGELIPDSIDASKMRASIRKNRLLRALLKNVHNSSSTDSESASSTSSSTNTSSSRSSSLSAEDLDSVSSSESSSSEGRKKRRKMRRRPAVLRALPHLLDYDPRTTIKEIGGELAPPPDDSPPQKRPKRGDRREPDLFCGEIPAEPTESQRSTTTARKLLRFRRMLANSRKQTNRPFTMEALLARIRVNSRQRAELLAPPEQRDKGEGDDEEVDTAAWRLAAKLLRKTVPVGGVFESEQLAKPLDSNFVEFVANELRRMDDEDEDEDDGKSSNKRRTASEHESNEESEKDYSKHPRRSARRNASTIAADAEKKTGDNEDDEDDEDVEEEQEEIIGIRRWSILGARNLHRAKKEDDEEADETATQNPSVGFSLLSTEALRRFHDYFQLDTPVHASRQTLVASARRQFAELPVAARPAIAFFLHTVQSASNRLDHPPLPETPESPTVAKERMKPLNVGSYAEKSLRAIYRFHRRRFLDEKKAQETRRNGTADSGL